MRPFDPTKVCLVCPDNDAESRLILLIAYRLGLCVIRSGQGLGATLEREHGNILELIQATGCPEVWIVEIPGPEVEQKIRDSGLSLTIIDHHVYGELDRSRGADGNLLPSSLEQFLTLTDLTFDRLATWGFDPIVVGGIAIMDTRFVQGLREEGFTQEEICRVLDFRRACARANFPDFDKMVSTANHAWRNRTVIGDYIVVRSYGNLPIRGIVYELSIYDQLDTRPIIIVQKSGDEIFVQNIDVSVTKRLMTTFDGDHIFHFDQGRSWGVNNVHTRYKIPLNHILWVLQC